MFKVISVALAALVLMSCGGGGGESSPAPLSSIQASDALEARRASPGVSFIAEPMSVVNTTVLGNQVLRGIGATSDGGYTVAWISVGSTLYMQTYDSTGAKSGAQTPIPLNIEAVTPDVAMQAIEAASVAVLSDGSVVVAYPVSRNTDLPNGTVSTKTGVYIQRFDANGVQIVGETEVASREEVLHSRSPVTNQITATALSDGGFVVSWAVASFSAQYGSVSTLSLQRFDSGGQPVGSPIEVGQYAALAYRIAADARGGFTLTAQQFTGRTTEYSVFHYDANMSSRLVVPPRFGPALLLPLEGGYVLYTTGPEGDKRQFLDSSGNLVGEVTDSPNMPLAARELADGTYIVIWVDGNGSSVQRFTADGTLMGGPLPIQTDVLPQVVTLVETGIAIAWSDAAANADSDVYTQRFVEIQSDTKKSCLNAAKGLKGKERRDFVRACLA